MSGGPFHVLRHRDFRLLWLGLVGSAIGTWMQIVAQALLVLDLTHGSAFALGEVSLAQAAAFFVFSLFGGAVADHVDKRKLLLFTQTICMSLAILLGVLDLLHVVRVWMIVVLAFTNGVALSFDQPTRAALIPELVPKDEILSAFSLQAIVFTGASTVGPALAGLLLPKIHYAGVFFASGASYLLILGALFAIRFEHVAAPTRTPSPQAIKDGLAAVKADVALPSLLLVYGAMLFFGPSPAILLPVMGTKVLHLDSQHLGFWFAATGGGTVVGGLVLASLNDPRRKIRILLASALFWSLALAGFAASRSFFPSLGALTVVGLFQVGVTATMIALLQTRVPRAMSGRVMSINTLLIMGVRPLGDSAAASVIAKAGAPFTATACAAIVGVLALFVLANERVRTA